MITKSNSLTRQWLFNVSCQAKPGEEVFVVGSLSELGEWDPQKAVPLDFERENPIRSEDTIRNDHTVWRAIINLPPVEVEFRYFIGAKLHFEEGAKIVIMRWETNLSSRTIPATGSNLGKSTLEYFGWKGDLKKIDQGWLDYDSIFQLKLTPSKIHGEPVALWSKKYVNKKKFVKLTPIDMLRQKKEEQSSPIDESNDVELSQLRMESNIPWPLTEVTVMNDEQDRYRTQEQFGVEFTGREMIIYQTRMLKTTTIAFLVDYYVEEVEHATPKYVGCSFILPGSVKENFGVLSVPITSKKQIPIGQLTAHYLFVHPMEGLRCDMKISYSRYWKASWTGLEVGHRGAGNSFHKQTKCCSNIRENTIASLKYAAENGADMVEFDVQLSKDLIPVLYHDFHVHIGLNKKSSGDYGLLEIPVKDLDLNQLQNLKIYHRTENGLSRFEDEDFDEHQPFPTLEKAMDVVPDSCAFNVEIKWTMRRHDGSYELENPFELNRYLDIILKVVLSSSSKRKIVFSCFHPDICSMLRLKQNKYPVLFLTNGNFNIKSSVYDDIRTHNFENAVHYAASANLLGVDVECDTLLQKPELIEKAFHKKLIVFCWGDNNCDKNSIRFLKKLGVHGIIYDKIDTYLIKEKKESIFVCDDEEAQNCILAQTDVIDPIKEQCRNGVTSFKGILEVPT